MNTPAENIAAVKTSTAAEEIDPADNKNKRLYTYRYKAVFIFRKLFRNTLRLTPYAHIGGKKLVFFKPYLYLLLNPITGGMIPLAGQVKFGFGNKLRLFKTVYAVPCLYGQLFLGRNAEIKVVPIRTALVAAVLSPHFKIFKFGYFKGFFTHYIIPRKIRYTNYTTFF